MVVGDATYSAQGRTWWMSKGWLGKCDYLVQVGDPGFMKITQDDGRWVLLGKRDGCSTRGPRDSSMAVILIKWQVQPDRLPLADATSHTMLDYRMW